MRRKDVLVDHAVIKVIGGRGGNGASHFHREKYVPLGGPDGGDGGHGGQVILQADENINTLVDFTFRHEFHAEAGKPGSGNRMYGRHGQDCLVRVPVGTLVLNLPGECLADLDTPGQQVVVAKGGRGGRGNVHFTTALRRAPKLAELGEPGEEHELILELKLLADVGLLGLPNAGKSTLLSALSAARPKIADYPFTTLIPNLGVVRIDEEASFVMVDLPGLIAGAAQGEGLGHEFLRHVERTRLFIHLVDIGFPGVEPKQSFQILQQELAAYDPALAQRPQLVALNKIDLVSDPAYVADLMDYFHHLGYQVFPISAATRQGVWDLARQAYQQLSQLPKVPVIKHDFKPGLVKPEPRLVLEALGPGRWRVRSREVEKWVAMTDFNNEEAVAKLRYILEHIGLNEEFRRQQVAAGDTILVGKEEFLFQEDL